MLKIKKQVKLEKLEKFGFKLDLIHYQKFFENGKYLIEIPFCFKFRGRIYFYKKRNGFYFQTRTRKRLIKDLIKAGLVEKAQEITNE